MDENIDTINSLTGAKYTRAQIINALEKADDDIDDAIKLLIDSKRPTQMFTSQVIDGSSTKKKIA